MNETEKYASGRTDRTMKVLVPVDGSEFSERAVDYLIKLYETQGSIDIHILNVQIPIASGHARMFSTEAEIDAYHRDEGMKVLEATLERLRDEGIPCAYHVLVGHIARTIIRFAEEEKFDKVVMGTQGRSGLTHLLLGSVAEEVLKELKIPVVLVK